MRPFAAATCSIIARTAPAPHPAMNLAPRRRCSSGAHHTRRNGAPYPYQSCPTYRSIHEGRSFYVQDEVLWRKDGTAIPVEYSAHPVFEDGRVQGAVVTFIGNWIDQNHYVAASAWWDLGWDLPIVAAGLVAVSWRPSLQPEAALEASGFAGFVAKNLSLIAVLGSLHVVMDRWKDARESVLANIAVSATLLAFTLRLALTQYHQQQEIVRRKIAQNQVSAANRKINLLLEDARRQTDEVTQISELGSLLQACSAPAEAYCLISERLQRLFPGASGSLAPLLAAWGPKSMFIVLMAVAAFGYLMRPAGLVIATIVLIMGSAWAGHEFKLKEALLNGVALVLIVLVVFVYFLDFQVPIWPAFLVGRI